MGSVVLRGCVLRALFLGLRTPPFRCCPLFFGAATVASTATPTPTPTATTTATTVGRVVRCCLGGSVYAYISPAGYRVVVDTCTRTVLKVEYDLDSGALGVHSACYRGL